MFCDLCNMKFENEFAWRSHEYSPQHHQALDKTKFPNERIHSCQLCSLKPTTYVAWLRHIREIPHCEKLTELKHSLQHSSRPMSNHRRDYDARHSPNRYRSDMDHNSMHNYRGHNSRNYYSSRDNPRRYNSEPQPNISHTPNSSFNSEPAPLNKVISHATELINNSKRERELRGKTSEPISGMSVFSIPPPELPIYVTAEPTSHKESEISSVNNPEPQATTSKSIPSKIKQNLLAKASKPHNPTASTSVSSLDTSTLQRLLFGPKTAKHKKILEDISKQSYSIRERANSREEGNAGGGVGTVEVPVDKVQEGATTNSTPMEISSSDFNIIEQPVMDIPVESSTPLTKSSSTNSNKTRKSNKLTKRKVTSQRSSVEQLENNTEINKIQRAVQLNKEEAILKREIMKKECKLAKLQAQIDEMQLKCSAIRKERQKIYIELQNEASQEENPARDDSLSEGSPPIQESPVLLPFVSDNIGEQTERELIRKVILSEKSKDFSFAEIDQLLKEEINVVSSTEIIDKKRRLSTSSVGDSSSTSQRVKTKKNKTNPDTTVVDLDTSQTTPKENFEFKPMVDKTRVKTFSSSCSSSDDEDCQFDSLNEPLIKELGESWLSGQIQVSFDLISMDVVDNDLFACGSNCLKIYNLKNFKCKNRLKLKLNQISCMAVYQTRIFVTSNNIMAIYCAVKGQELMRKVFEFEIRVIHFDLQEKNLYMGLSNGRIFVFNLEKNCTLDSYKGCETSVLSIATTKEGSRNLIICASKEEVSIRDASSGLYFKTIYPVEQVHSVKVDSVILYIACQKSIERHYYSLNNEKKLGIINMTEIVASLTVAKKFLIVGDVQGFITVFKINDSANESVVKKYCMYKSEPVSHLMCIASNSSPDHIISGNNKGLVMVRLLTVQSLLCKYGDCNKLFNTRDDLIYHVAKDHVLSSSSEYVTCEWMGCCYRFNTSKQGLKSIESHVESHI